MVTTNELEIAYRATTYRLFLPKAALDLRIDILHPLLVAWLQTHGVEQWAILTAANPASRCLPARENAERQAKLECALLEAGYEPFVVENRADDSHWPVEEACFVPGISQLEVMNLARQFGQNAVLLGSEKGIPRLVWAEKSEE